MERKGTINRAVDDTVQTAEQPRLAFTGRVELGVYINRDNVKLDTVNIVLDNPFDDEDVGVISLIPKWRQDKGVFDYKAKKALRTTDSIPVTGYFTVNEFTSKQLKRRIKCVGIYLNNPFFEGVFELKNRNIEQQAVIAMILSDIFGVKLSRFADDEAAEVDDHGESSKS